MNRRRFLKVSAVAAGVLALGAIAYKVIAPEKGTALTHPQTAAMLTAVIPAVLGGGLPNLPSPRTAAIANVAQRFVATVKGLSLNAQAEIDQLLALLAMKPTRLALTGINDWETATPDEVAKFLQRWRTSSLNDLQAGYHALHDLIGGSFYSDPLSWPAIGYAPPEMFQA